MIGLIAVAAVAASQLTATAADSPCELHLYGVTYNQQVATGNALVRAIPTSTDPTAFINVMNPQERMKDLSDEDYIAALGLPAGTRVFRHWDTPNRSLNRKATAPLLPPRANCNAELIGYTSLALEYKRSNLRKDEVRVNFAYREYGRDGLFTFKVDDGGFTAIAPARKTNSDRETALADLRNGSKEILSRFAKEVAKKRTKQKRAN